MAGGEQPKYRLSTLASSDLRAIWDYSAETWSIDQALKQSLDFARLFDLIAVMPGMGRERTEFTPPVRIHATGKHIIIYTVSDGAVVIVRVFHARQNWGEILGLLDP